MESEIFPSLRVAGIDGQVDAVLSEKSLLLERADGKGMRIELESIVRIRHHHVAITPPLLTLFGVLAMVASFRVLDGRPQVYAFILGSAAILFWALGRRPALTVDTRQGDRHIIYGRDHRLQRIYIMIDRMSEGASLDEARLGLDELQQLELQSIGNLDDIQHELSSIEAAEAQLVGGGASGNSLEQALASIRGRRERAFGTDEPIFNAELFDDENTPAVIPDARALVTQSDSAPTSQTTIGGSHEDIQTATAQYAPANTHTQEPVPQEGGLPQEAMFGRATRALQEQREGPTTPNPTYDAPFQAPAESTDMSADSAYERCWGRTNPNWYEERDADSAPLSRAASAAKAASEANFDTGGMFGIFDQLDDDGDSVSQEYPASAAIPEPTSQPNYNPPTPYGAGQGDSPTTLPVRRAQTPAWDQGSPTQPSSYSMLSAALGDGNALPEPTSEALRPGIPVSPNPASAAPRISGGLVASARVAEPAIPEAQNLASHPKFARKGEQEILNEYPALSRMHKQSVNDTRLRLNRSHLGRRRGAMETLGQWVRPGLKRLEKKGREFSKLIVGEDSYSETYGDEDGTEGDQFEEAELRTDQLLRLRADQDAQSDVAERLRLLTRNGGGEIADDLASRTLRGISDSAPTPALVLDSSESKNLEGPASLDKMLCTSDPAPGFGGMRRLG